MTKLLGKTSKSVFLEVNFLDFFFFEVYPFFRQTLEMIVRKAKQFNVVEVATELHWNFMQVCFVKPELTKGLQLAANYKRGDCYLNLSSEEISPPPVLCMYLVRDSDPSRGPSYASGIYLGMLTVRFFPICGSSRYSRLKTPGKTVHSFLLDKSS